MEGKDRKQRFVLLLKNLLDESGGVKGNLANKLNIKPSTLTPWLQGKIDPASLDVLVFIRLAELKKVSVDEICNLLGVIANKSELSLQFKFRSVIKQLLADRSLKEFAKLLEVSQNAISPWTNPEEEIDPTNITIDKIVAIAHEKGWTSETLLTYLGLKKPLIQKNQLSQVQFNATALSLQDRFKLQAWLSGLIQEQVIESTSIKIENNCKLLVILETEDLAIATNYASNLVLHLNLKPENIKVTTIPNLPGSIADIDILIFDISTSSSASIALIEDIEFDRDIVVFVDADLPSEVRSSFESKVTDVIVKPIDWQKLKDKAYFS
ncbi:MAG: hypothetical protein ACFBSE_18685 [Prochloraceae cyanobacterium]